MKFGVRKPNIKSSIKARTTGKAKRRLKKALIPGYGKKGMGWIRDPKKAAYNYVYHRTTVGVGDIAKAATKKKPEKKANKEPKAERQKPIEQPVNHVKEKRKTGFGFIVAAILFAMAGIYGLSEFEASLTWVLSEIVCVVVVVLSFRKWSSMREPAAESDKSDQ